MTRADRSGCLIIGDTGMGKTALARAVSAVLKEAHPVFGISGTPALSRMAFAVLAPFLAGMDNGAEPGQEQVFAAIGGFFRNHRAKRNQIPIMIIDDAHDLDPDSRTIMARLVAADTVRVLVLSPPSSTPVEFLELWTDGFLRRCSLEPLGQDDIHALCENVLQGQVLRSVSAMVAHMSQGNPSTARALLRQGRADGTLFERNGVWLAADVPCTDAAFSARLRRELMRLARDEFELLESIALAEPLPLELLTAGGTRHHLDNLESMGLVAVSHGAPGSVRHANPVFSDVLRRTVSPVRSSELRRMYGHIVEDSPPERLIRYVSWALDCGAPLTPQVMVRAARAANEKFDFRFTLRVAAAAQGSDALGSGELDEMLLETAIAHAHLGHEYVARDRLERLLSESDNLPVLLRAVLWICQMPIADSDPGQQHRLRTLLTGTADRLAGFRAARPGDELIERIIGLVHVLDHVAAGTLAEVEDALDVLAWHTPGIDVKTRAVSLTMLGNLQNTTGRTGKGLAATSLALDLAQKNSSHLRMDFEYVFLHHVKGLLLAGHWDEAAVRLANYRQGGSRSLIYSGAAIQLFEGILAVEQGRVKFGLQHLQPAIEGLRQGRHTELLPLGLGMLAYAAALGGEAEIADECMESFPLENTCGDEGAFLWGKAYLLAAMGVIRRTDDAAQRLSDLAAEATAGGFMSVSRTALTLAIRAGHAGSASSLADLTSTVDGPMTKILHIYSRAVMSGDADTLLDAAADARREGFYLTAVNCAEQAVVVMDADAGRTRRNAAQMLLQQYRTLLDGPFVLACQESSRTGRLTPREQEIVDLAQSGQSNREIARSLSLSARTVEGHLYRIFAKVGVNSRAELLAAMPLPGLGRA
ncbi:LuxR C-terminal-related transcriptional regulator [Arthrobacter sp. Z1-9]